MISSRSANLLPLIVALLAAGCGTTAKVYTKDGAVIEGRISRSDASTVFVQPAERPGGNRAHPDGIFAQEIFDECVEERTAKCKRKCSYRYSGTDKRKKCMKSCLNRKEAMETCRPISVVIPVSRSDIESISHPGKTAALVGTLAVALGGAGGFLLIVYGSATYGDDDYEYRTEAGPILGWIGLLVEAGAVASIFVAIWGYAHLASSSSAAAAPKDTAGVRISPVAIHDGHRTYHGLGLTFTW